MDYVLPRIPWRQWTLAFPRRLRVALLKDELLLNKVLGAFVRTVFASQRLRARKLGFVRPLPGAVVFIQNFTDALLVHPHFHALFPDGVFEGKDVSFAPLPPPEDADVEQLLKRLCPLVVKPGVHLTRFYGVFAPNSKWRRLVVPRRCLAVVSPPAPGKLPPNDSQRERTRPKRPPRLDWAALLRRVFEDDVLACPCGGRRTVLALITNPDVARRQLGLPPHTPRLRALPTGPPQLALL